MVASLLEDSVKESLIKSLSQEKYDLLLRDILEEVDFNGFNENSDKNNHIFFDENSLSKTCFKILSSNGVTFNESEIYNVIAGFSNKLDSIFSNTKLIYDDIKTIENCGFLSLKKLSNKQKELNLSDAKLENIVSHSITAMKVLTAAKIARSLRISNVIDTKIIAALTNKDSSKQLLDNILAEINLPTDHIEKLNNSFKLIENNYKSKINIALGILFESESNVTLQNIKENYDEANENKQLILKEISKNNKKFYFDLAGYIHDFEIETYPQIVALFHVINNNPSLSKDEIRKAYLKVANDIYFSSLYIANNPETYSKRLYNYLSKKWWYNFINLAGGLSIIFNIKLFTPFRIFYDLILLNVLEISEIILRSIYNLTRGVLTLNKSRIKSAYSDFKSIFIGEKHGLYVHRPSKIQTIINLIASHMLVLSANRSMLIGYTFLCITSDFSNWTKYKYNFDTNFRKKINIYNLGLAFGICALVSFILPKFAISVASNFILPYIAIYSAAFGASFVSKDLSALLTVFLSNYWIYGLIKSDLGINNALRMAGNEVLHTAKTLVSLNTLKNLSMNFMVYTIVLAPIFASIYAFYHYFLNEDKKNSASEYFNRVKNSSLSKISLWKSKFMPPELIKVSDAYESKIKNEPKNFRNFFIDKYLMLAFSIITSHIPFLRLITLNAVFENDRKNKNMYYQPFTSHFHDGFLGKLAKFDEQRLKFQELNEVERLDIFGSDKLNFLSKDKISHNKANSCNKDLQSFRDAHINNARENMFNNPFITGV
ncbi:MAG: hypothetical protein J0G32_03650 [Alphaproteobacteria bacterium]|nr:hypothetical protein [Alphaproteobacteria bacterium]